MKKRGCPMDELRRVIVLLMETGVLPVKYKPHKLNGNHKGQWECHIKPDWLLVWEQNLPSFFYKQERIQICFDIIVLTNS